MQVVTFINIDILASGIILGYVTHCSMPAVVHKLLVLQNLHKGLLILYANGQEKLKSFQSLAWHFWCVRNVKT